MGFINVGVLSGYLERRRGSKKNKKNIHADHLIRKEVFETLKWNPDVDTTDIGIVVNEGIVSLYGSVDSVHAQKIAEEVTDDIPGVVDVDNHLAIRSRLDIDSNKVVARGDNGFFTKENNPS